MKATLHLLLLTAAVAALSLPARADDRQTQPKESTTTESSDSSDSPASTGPTFKDLLAKGYEVKAVSVIPHDIVKRGGSTTDVDAAMIILQKGGEAATCYTEFTSFANGAFVTLPCTEYK